MKKNSSGKVIAFTGGIVIALVVSGIAALWIMFPPEKIKTIVTSEVGKVLGRTVKIDKAGISVYPVIGFSLSGVEISNTNRPGYSDSAFLKFDRFLVSISVASLIKKQPEIKRIILKRPNILLEVDSTGSFNFNDLAIMKSDTAKKISTEKKQGLPVLPVPITLQSFVIEDGRFIYHDARSKQDLIVSDIDDKIVFSIDKELNNISTSGDLSLAGISLKTKELTKPLSNLTVTFHHDIGADLKAGNAQIKALRLSFQKVFLTLSGTITDLNTVPRLDCKITSDSISIQDLIKEVPVELAPVLGNISAEGKLLLGLEVKGTLEKNAPLPVKGTVAINNGLLRYTNLPKSVNQINLQCAFTENSLDIASLKLRFGENPVALKAKVDNFKKPLIDLKLRANMNLGDVKDFAKLPAGASLSGSINADINANGYADPSDPSKIAVLGKLELNKVTAMFPPLVKPAVINGGITLSSQMIGNALSIVIGRSQMTMNTTISNYLSFVFPDSTKKLPRPEVKFNIASSVLDVDEFMPPQEKKPQTAKTGKTGNSGPIIAPLPGVDVRGNITAKNVVYNKIPIINVLITINVINDIADIVIKTGFAGGLITENLHANMKNVSNLAFTNKLNIKDVEINDVMSSFGNFLPPTTALNRELNNLPKSLLGKINLSSDFSGNGGSVDEIVNNLKGDMGLKMVDGTITNSIIVSSLSKTVDKFVKLGDIRFRDLSASLKVANNSLLIDKLELMSGAGDWKADGSIGFDTKLNITINNRLPKDISASLLNVQNSGKNLVKGLLQGSELARSASSLIDNTGIPSDNDGRITLLLGLSGTATDPKTSFIGFGKGAGSAKKQQESPKEQVMTKINEKVDQAKLEAQKRLDEEKQHLAEEKRQAEAKLQQQAAEQKQVVQEKKADIQQQIQKNTKDKLKKLF